MRLKGGDPFIFGRGGEELQALARAGVPFDVAPGHHRGERRGEFRRHPADAPRLRAALHLRHRAPEGRRQRRSRLVALARPRQTVVIYMGLAGLPRICAQLRAHGLPADWPAAVVSHGTLAAQRVVCATLATLPEAAARATRVAVPDDRRRGGAAARRIGLVRTGRRTGCRVAPRQSPPRAPRRRTPRPRRASSG